jgi:hypothetical protein
MHKLLSFLFAGLLLTAGPAFSQKESERNVSGPDQWDSQKPTGKSYKKGAKRNPTKQENPSTGQTKRLGNTADMTKKGNDVNGDRGESTNPKKSNPKNSGTNSTSK